MRAFPLLLFVLLPFTGSSVESLTIDAGSVVRPTTTRPLGINFNYLLDDEARRPAGSPRTLSQAVGDMGAHFLRFPGGEKSDNYLWTTRSASDGTPVTTSDTIPAMLAPRVADPQSWPGNGAFADATSGRYTGANLDFDEFMSVCRTRGGEPVIVVACDSAREITGSATAPTLAELIASAVAWVKYANITKGYGIRFWSIGNESWFRSGMTAATYAGHVNQFATAMRAVDPTIRIGAHGNSQAWFQTVIQQSVASIDWLDVHDYPTWNWSTGYDVFRTGSPSLIPNVNQAIAALGVASVSDQARLMLCVTETGAIDYGTTPWPHLNDLGHALVTFDIIGQQISKPKVAFTQLWNTRWINNAAYSAGSGGGNPITNPGFENNLTGWNATAAVIVTSPIHGGTKALQGNGGAYVYQDVALGAGLTRTLSGWGRTTSTALWSGFGVDLLNSVGTKLAGTSLAITATSTYANYSIPFITPTGTTTARIWFYVSAGTTASIDDLLLSDHVEPEVYDAFTPDNSYQPVGRAVALWGNFLRDELVQGSRSASVIAYGSRSAGDGSLAVWLLNKQTGPIDITLTLSGYTPAASASAWRFSGAGPSDFAPTYAALAAVAVPGATLSLNLPQTSITVLVFTPASAAAPSPVGVTQ